MRVYWEHCKTFPGEINLMVEWDEDFAEVLGYAKNVDGVYVYYGLSNFGRNEELAFSSFLRLSRTVRRGVLVSIIGGHIK